MKGHLDCSKSQIEKANLCISMTGDSIVSWTTNIEKESYEKKVYPPFPFAKLLPCPVLLELYVSSKQLLFVFILVVDELIEKNGTFVSKA